MPEQHKRCSGSCLISLKQQNSTKIKDPLQCSFRCRDLADRRERNHLPLWNGESFWDDGDWWWCNIRDLVRADVPIHLVQECLRGRDEVVGDGDDLGLVCQVVPL